MTPAVSNHLAVHTWPGNVRELSHYAERIALGLGDEQGAESDAKDTLGLSERMDRFEGDAIREALARHGGDVRRTIEALKLPRKTFYDKLQRHGITRKAFENDEG